MNRFNVGSYVVLNATDTAIGQVVADNERGFTVSFIDGYDIDYINEERCCFRFAINLDYLRTLTAEQVASFYVENRYIDYTLGGGIKHNVFCRLGDSAYNCDYDCKRCLAWWLVQPYEGWVVK